MCVASSQAWGHEFPLPCPPPPPLPPSPSPAPLPSPTTDMFYYDPSPELASLPPFLRLVWGFRRLSLTPLPPPSLHPPQTCLTTTPLFSPLWAACLAASMAWRACTTAWAAACMGAGRCRDISGPRCRCRRTGAGEWGGGRGRGERVKEVYVRRDREGGREWGIRMNGVGVSSACVEVWKCGSWSCCGLLFLPLDLPPSDTYPVLLVVSGGNRLRSVWLRSHRS